jgi:hypothetical protein
VLSDWLAAIADGDDLLSLKTDAEMVQLNGERGLIDGFQVTRPQLAVDDYGGPNHLANQVLRFHLGFGF